MDPVGRWIIAEIVFVFLAVFCSLAAHAVRACSESKLIRAAVSGENVADYTAEVSEVSDALKKELAEEIKNGLEIKPTKGVQGFKLAAKDGSGFFDCTDDAIMEMLMPHFRNLEF